MYREYRLRSFFIGYAIALAGIVTAASIALRAGARTIERAVTLGGVA